MARLKLYKSDIVGWVKRSGTHRSISYHKRWVPLRFTQPTISLFKFSGRQLQIMKVSTKGQITIPLHLRIKTGIVPGAKVEFSEEKGRIYIRKVENVGRGALLVKQMTGRGNVKMSTDEILALTRGDA